MAWFDNIRFPYFNMQQLNLDWLLDKVRGFLPKNDDQAVAGDIIVRQADGSSMWETPGSVSVDIHSLTGESTAAADDEFIMYQDASASNKKIKYSDLESEIVAAVPGLNITGMTALTTPATGDEFPIYDISATTNKKITLSTLEDKFVTDKKATIISGVPVINTLPSLTTPDANDLFIVRDTSAAANKQVQYSDVKKDFNTFYVGDTITIDGTFVGYCFGATVARLLLFITKDLDPAITGITFSGSCAYVRATTIGQVNNPVIASVALQGNAAAINLTVSGATNFEMCNGTLTGTFTFT